MSYQHEGQPMNLNAITYAENAAQCDVLADLVVKHLISGISTTDGLAGYVKYERPHIDRLDFSARSHQVSILVLYENKIQSGAQSWAHGRFNAYVIGRDEELGDLLFYLDIHPGGEIGFTEGPYHELSPLSASEDLDWVKTEMSRMLVKAVQAQLAK